MKLKKIVFLFINDWKKIEKINQQKKTFHDIQSLNVIHKILKGTEFQYVEVEILF